MGKAAEYILHIPFWAKDKHTVSQLQDILKKMGDPQDDLRIIHVAGTNGKGSVCADLTAILTEAGYHVGTFVSPHLTDLRERFLLDGEWISEEELEQSFLCVCAALEAAEAEKLPHPTFFEFVFLIAMDYYHRKQPDFVILETGLGGRLDATNAVKHPLACVITSISFDHMQILGSTIREIAGEKAGIIKKGAPVIYDANDAEAADVIAAAARAVGADAYPMSEADVTDFGVDFAAPYQAMNAALAVQTLRVLRQSMRHELPTADPVDLPKHTEGAVGDRFCSLPKHTEEAVGDRFCSLPKHTEEAASGRFCSCLADVTDTVIQRGLSKVRWPGRMQQLAPDIWVDGAHNPGGIAAFVRAVRSQKSEKAIHLLFAAVSDKDYTEMIRELTEGLTPSRVTVAHIDSGRGLDEGILAEKFRQVGCLTVEQYRTAAEAWQAALAHKTDKDRLYLVGSLYLIGEIMKEISADGREETSAGQ